MKAEEKKCNELVEQELRDRMKDIRAIYKRMMNGGEWQEINEYGLCFDYVEPNTFEEQDQGYYRWQISWGEPSDEFRLYDDGQLEYAYMDWFDGATTDLDCNDEEIVLDIMNYFKSCI